MTALEQPRQHPCADGVTAEGLRTWTVPLPWPDPPLSMNDRRHWRPHGAAVADTRETAQQALRVHRPRLEPLERCRVELHWQPSTDRTRDSLNPVATLKPLCDALVDVGVVPDDDIWRMTTLMPAVWPADPTGPARCWLVITELAPLADAPLATRREPWVRGARKSPSGVNDPKQGRDPARGASSSKRRRGRVRGQWPVDQPDRAVPVVPSAALTSTATPVPAPAGSDWAARVANNANRIRRERR